MDSELKYDLQRVDSISKLDDERKKTQLEFDNNQAIVNSTSKEIGGLMSKGQKEEAEVKKKPLTDEKLMHLLKEKGYNIARRTVGKYREQLNIPVARLRKEL